MREIHHSRVKARYRLTRENSSKEIYHVVLDTKGSGLTYKPGDALAVYAPNDPEMVARIVSALQIRPKEPVVHPRTGAYLTAEEFFTTQVNLSQLPRGLRSLAGNEPCDLLDVAQAIGPLQEDLNVWVKELLPLLPRFYSIASSPTSHPEEVHLVVALTSFFHGHEQRFGVASHFLCRTAAEDVQCYVQSTPHFTLPSDPTLPIIMVGPGTGIAPFRGFVQERIACRHSGNNWLFFGERHRATDFLYEELWTPLVEQGKLQMSLAFSRDQPDRVYVQHLLAESGQEIWDWLGRGAHLYVCGKKDPMAIAVTETVQAICHKHGCMSEEEALRYVRQLRSQKRYLTDVY